MNNTINFNSETDFRILKINVDDLATSEDDFLDWSFSEDGFINGSIQVCGNYLYVPSSGMEGDESSLIIYSTYENEIYSSLTFTKQYGEEETPSEPTTEEDNNFLYISASTRDDAKHETIISVVVSGVTSDFVNDVRHWLKTNKVKVEDYSVEIIYDENIDEYSYINKFTFYTKDAEEDMERPFDENGLVNFYAVDERNRVHNASGDVASGIVTKYFTVLYKLIEEIKKYNFNFTVNATCSDGTTFLGECNEVSKEYRKSNLTNTITSITSNINYTPSIGFNAFSGGSEIYGPETISYTGGEYNLNSLSSTLNNVAYVKGGMWFGDNFMKEEFTTNTTDASGVKEITLPHSSNYEVKISTIDNILNFNNAISIDNNEFPEWIAVDEATKSLTIAPNTGDRSRTYTVRYEIPSFDENFFSEVSPTDISSFSDVKEVIIKQFTSTPSRFTIKIKIKNENVGKVIDGTNLGIMNYDLILAYRDGALEEDYPSHFSGSSLARGSTVEQRMTIEAEGIYNSDAYLHFGSATEKIQEDPGSIDVKKWANWTDASKGQRILKVYINEILDKSSEYEATTIYSQCFSACSAMTSATIVNKTVIDNRAFCDCTSLSELNLGDGLTTINASAFTNCRLLDTVHVPNTVTAIRRGAYNGCEDVEYINFYSSTANISLGIGEYSSTGVGKGLFADCVDLSEVYVGRNLIYGPSASETYEGCGYSPFYNNPNLSTVLFGNTISKISNYCFMDCKRIQQVLLPPSLQTIESNAFKGCEGIDNLTLGHANGAIPKLETIGENAFFGCSHLAKVLIPEKTTTLGQGCFDGCTLLSTVVLGGPNDITIGDNAFDCRDSSSVNIYIKNTNANTVHLSSDSFKNRSGAKLWVPSGSSGSYESRSEFLGFDISEYDFSTQPSPIQPTPYVDDGRQNPTTGGVADSYFEIESIADGLELKMYRASDPLTEITNFKLSEVIDDGWDAKIIAVIKQTIQSSD